MRTIGLPGWSISGIVGRVIVYYAAMSLDARISGLDHDLSFLKTLDAPNDYETFYADVDSLILGVRVRYGRR